MDPLRSSLDRSTLEVDDELRFSVHFGSRMSYEDARALCFECVTLAHRHTRRYQWQAEPFNMRAVDPATDKHSGVRTARTYLSGRVLFGDNIEDEWLCVWILFTLSKTLLRDAVLEMHDTDGSFLLIEAALAIPLWLNPENSENRVFVHQGKVHLIPPPMIAREFATLPLEPTLDQAVSIVLAPHVPTCADSKVQRAIQKRIKGFPEAAMKQMHTARVIVPEKVAWAIESQPELLSASITAFYRRDPLDMSAARKAKYMKPEKMRAVSVRFSKCLYAQLSQQRYFPPKSFPPLPSPADPNFMPVSLGCKLAAGMEMLVCRAKNIERRRAKSGEPVEPPRLNIAEQPWWPSLKEQITKQNGKDAIDEDTALRLAEKMERLDLEAEPLDTSVLQYLDEVPASHKWADVVKDDDLRWFKEGSAELDTLLKEREQELKEFERQAANDEEGSGGGGRGGGGLGSGGGGGGGLGSADGGSDGESEVVDSSGPRKDTVESAAGVATKVVDTLRGFVGDESDVYGVEPGSLKWVGSEADALPDVSASAPISSIDFADDSDSDDSDDGGATGARAPRRKATTKEGLRPVTINFDTIVKVLQGHNVQDDAGLADGDGDDSASGYMSSGSDESVPDGKLASLSMDEIMRAMDSQLGSTTLGSSFARAPTTKEEAGDGDSDDSDDSGDSDDEGGGVDGTSNKEMGPVDVDFNLVRYLMESVGAQSGSAGPASNVLGELGVEVPADWVAGDADVGPGVSVGKDPEAAEAGDSEERKHTEMDAKRAPATGPGNGSESRLPLKKATALAEHKTTTPKTDAEIDAELGVMD